MSPSTVSSMSHLNMPVLRASKPIAVDGQPHHPAASGFQHQLIFPEIYSFSPCRFMRDVRCRGGYGGIGDYTLSAYADAMRRGRTAGLSPSNDTGDEKPHADQMRRAKSCRDYAMRTYLRGVTRTSHTTALWKSHPRINLERFHQTQ